MPPRGWILYDGTCGFCLALARRLCAGLRRRGIATAPLQAPWVAELMDDPADDIAADIRLLLADGTLFTGADVYRFALAQTVLTYPLYLLSRMFPVSDLFDLCYRFVARNRHRLSRLCALTAPGEGRRPNGSR
ncbi:MAG TPA: DCC1-like thiol-disulfide oxidoreductase family protein [Bacteroidota bacterium]|nr:DCC1-like thiol-disulfide oxidoreductase family protein [Bacteroidota bacterium]